MSSCRKVKKNKNNENWSPTLNKRSKTITNWILTKPRSDNILTEMGVSILDSDESTSSGSTIILKYSGSDENSNEATPNLDASKCYHPANNRFNDSISSDTTENSSFVDPNETIMPMLYANNDNNNSKTRRTSDKKYDKQNHANEHLMLKPRSPLTSVLENTNNNLSHTKNNQHIIASNISIPSTSNDNIFNKNIAYELSDGYSMHNRRPSYGKINYFKQLSDEMVLQVFKWLPKKTLLRCSLVCHRFNQLAQDESLWSRLDLAGKFLRAEVMDQVLNRGVVVLRLAQSELVHPVLNPEKLALYPDFEAKLRYLDLSMTTITKPSLKQLLSRCYQLRKLSLEHVQINDEICIEIAKNKHMETLNLSMCEGLEAWTVEKLMLGLTNLNSLNVSWTSLDNSAVSALVTNMNPNIMRLNLAGCRKTMFDSHIATLAKYCTQLIELDISDCNGLTEEVIQIVCKFKNLEYLSLSRCYSIPAAAYMELTNLKSLAYLDVFGTLSKTAIQLLQNTFPSLGINKFYHSSVARPTVGTRRTSIWGLRTRD